MHGPHQGYNKRFQRLESHVVTLARSVAHLSSEMRNLQVVIQEVESLRMEMQQGGGGFWTSFFLLIDPLKKVA